MQRIGPGLDDPSPGELRTLREFLAGDVLHRPTLTRLDPDLPLLEWPPGRIVRPGDLVPIQEAKYLKHVLVDEEWPLDTTINQYLASLARVVRGERSGIYVDADETDWRISFVGRAGRSAGPGGSSHIVVVFIPAKARWLTGYQPLRGAREVERRRESQRGRWMHRAR